MNTFFSIAFGLLLVTGIAEANTYDSSIGEFALQYKIVNKTNAYVSQLPNQLEPSPQKKQSLLDIPNVKTSSCRFQMLLPIDERTNQSSIGATLDKPLRAKEVDAWLVGLQEDFNRHSLLSANKYVFTVQPRLTKLYADNLKTNMFGVMTMHLDIHYKGELVASSAYRSYADATNFAGALSEYNALMNRVARNWIKKSLSGLSQSCSELSS